MNDTAGSGQSVAIVLAPPGSEHVAVRALSAERPWCVQAVSDPMLAVAEVALATAAQRTRDSLEIVIEDDEAAGADECAENQRVAFVLAHPEKWKDRHELFEAVAIYFPRAQLFAFDERGLHEATVNQKARCKRVPASRPRSGGAQSESPAREGGPVRKENSSSSISREEIDMLLGGAGGSSGGRP